MYVCVMSGHSFIVLYMHYISVFVTNPNQEDGIREEGEGQGERSPDFSPQGPPDTMSLAPGLGEDVNVPFVPICTCFLPLCIFVQETATVGHSLHNYK